MKSQPNDHNISMQHIATLLVSRVWSPCRDMLDVLDIKFENGHNK